MKTVWVFILPFFILSCDTSDLLVRAAATGDLNYVKARALEGASLNTPAVIESRDGNHPLNGMTPLLAAACGVRSNPLDRKIVPADRITVVRYLIQSGADVNARHGKDQVPLLAEAVRSYCFDPSIVSALLKAGADPNQTDRFGRTSLFYATVSGDYNKTIAAVKLLVKAGVLQVATQEEILASYCFTIVAQEEAEQNQLALALADRLLSPEKMRCKLPYIAERPVLFLTAERGQTQVLDFLLSRMPDQDRKNALECSEQFARSLMTIAAEAGDVKTIRILHNYGGNVNQQCNFTLFNQPMVRIPIRLAVIEHHVEAAKLLIDLGADISYSSTHVHLLAYLAGSEDFEDLDRIIATMKLLLKHGARIDERDSEGRTPLMHAAMIGHPQMARFLLANKANFKLEDKNGWTPMMHAEAKNHVEFIRALRDAGAKK